MAESFFDTYEDQGGGSFITKDEKAILIDEGVSFDITEVIDQPDNAYNGKPRPRYLLTVLIEGEERKLAFDKGSVFSRDRALVAMSAHLAGGGDPIRVRIELEGRSQVLVDGS